MSEEKKIFDKKFVHCMWDAELEGKRCIVSDSIDVMIDAVDNGTYHTAVINRSKGGGYALHSNETGSDYTVAYYDPNYECKVAYAHGKQIQYKSFNGEWKNCLGHPCWADRDEYRVKPEKSWRPFKDIDELKHTWGIKRSPLVHPDLEEPEIWVRDKKRPDITRLITGFNGGCNCVALAGQWHILEALFGNYEFLDGTPCGVEE